MRPRCVGRCDFGRAGLPAAIADIAYQNKAVIYEALVKASSEALLTIAADDDGVTFKWNDYRCEGRDRPKTVTLQPPRVASLAASGRRPSALRATSRPTGIRNPSHDQPMEDRPRQVRSGFHSGRNVPECRV